MKTARHSAASFAEALILPPTASAWSPFSVPWRTGVAATVMAARSEGCAFPDNAAAPAATVSA